MMPRSLLTFLGMALATYFTRYTMIALLGSEVSPRLRRWGDWRALGLRA